MKLTLRQLQAAVSAARAIERLEKAKDEFQPEEVAVAGGVVGVTITREMFNAALARGMADAHNALADLGIELLPPEATS